MDQEENRKVDRRTFLKGGLAAGGVLGAGLAIRAVAEATGDSGTPGPAPVAPLRHVAPPTRKGSPNILVIIVDQLRFPQWFSPAPAGLGLPPNLSRLRQGAVSFARHYTASNDCSPSRAAMLTGLYTHQTGCMITGGSTLDPGFPTWGTMLREQGYHTRWYGKWHLTHPSGDGNLLAGSAHKGFALCILVRARSFADKAQFRVNLANAKYGLRPRRRQFRAARASQDAVAQ